MDQAITNCYAAVDIGASSGRVVVGRIHNGKIELTEIHRFDNLQKRIDGHDCWDIEMLAEETIRGLAKCKEAGFQPTSVGIDTWAVDFVLLDKDDHVLGNAVAYRDERTHGIFEEADASMSFEELYARAGIQRLAFNTVYQFVALKKEHPEHLAAAKSFLMIPDYLHFVLTGKKSNEYTNASSTSLLNARTQQWDGEILQAYGIPADIFLPPSMPGAVLGEFLPEIAQRIGYQAQVVLPATHDTGSAFLAVPARDEQAVFLSSGTWSLLGVENKEALTSEACRFQNFTNEGGYELRFRFLKNIMGLWMIQCIRRELNGVQYVAGTQAVDPASLIEGFEPGKTYGFSDLIELAQEAAGFEAYVDVNEERFLSPDCMIAEVQQSCKDLGQPVPRTLAQLMRCVYMSLVKCYEDAIANLSVLTGKTYTSINIVGGGCQDAFLDQMTASVCGVPVFAGPVEGTSLGNLAVQMIAAGEYEDTQEFRRAIIESFDVKRFDPQ